MDKDGKCYLYFKNENMTQFQKNFDQSVHKIYEKLAMMVSVYDSTALMGEVFNIFIGRNKRSLWREKDESS